LSQQIRDHRNPISVRIVAAWALGALADAHAIRHLSDTLTSDENLTPDAVRAACAIALGKGRNSSISAILTQVLYQTSSTSVRMACATSLANCGDTDAPTRLREIFAAFPDDYRLQTLVRPYDNSTSWQTRAELIKSHREINRPMKLEGIGIGSCRFGAILGIESNMVLATHLFASRVQFGLNSDRPLRLSMVDITVPNSTRRNLNLHEVSGTGDPLGIEWMIRNRAKLCVCAQCVDTLNRHRLFAFFQCSIAELQHIIHCVSEEGSFNLRNHDIGVIGASAEMMTFESRFHMEVGYSFDFSGGICFEISWNPIQTAL